MKRLRQTLITIALAILPVHGFAQSADQQTSTTTSGAPQASSANSVIDSAVDPTSGPITSSANYTMKHGYVAQLYDVQGLNVSAQIPAVGEETSTQTMGAAATLDDDTTLALPASDVAWSIVSGPIQSIASTGSVSTGSVFEPTPAAARGMWAGHSDDDTFTVLDTDTDNYGAVGGDGIDDSWQFQHFDDDRSGSLSFGELVSARPGADPDGDEQDNTFEFLAQFDPIDSTSLLDISIVNKTATAVTFRFSKAVPGIRYQLMGSTDLGMSDPWCAQLGAQQVAAVQTDVDFELNLPSSLRMFFRWELEKAP